MGLTVHPPLVEGASTPMQDASTPQSSDAARFLVEQSKGFSSTNRLTVLTIGAATDTASALLLDPSLADRIRIVAMGFTNLQADGAEEFNVLNDPHAWQAILKSRVPVVMVRVKYAATTCLWGTRRRSKCCKSWPHWHMAVGRISRLVLLAYQTAARCGLHAQSCDLGHYYGGVCTRPGNDADGASTVSDGSHAFCCRAERGDVGDHHACRYRNTVERFLCGSGSLQRNPFVAALSAALKGCAVTLKKLT